MKLHVKTYVVGDGEYVNQIIRLKEYIETIDKSDKLINNYIENLQEQNFIAISFYLTDNDDIVGFSSVLHRDLFGNGVRVLNRYYKDKNIRSRLETIPITQEMISQQLEIARELGYNFAFMSRETANGINTFKHFLKDNSMWIFDTDTKYQMFNTDNTGQFITWTNLILGATHELRAIR